MARAHAHRLKLRLFLEGVEVPIISANIQSAPNSPTVASLQLPPLAEGTRLFPRTIVHLFFLDFFEASNPFITNTGPAKPPTDTPDGTAHDFAGDGLKESRNVSSNTTNNSKIDIQNSRYKLLFGGEVIGFQWTKSVNQRSLILNCEDWSNYWDHAYQWNNTDMFGPGAKAIFSGGATSLFTDFLSSKGEVITSIVSRGRCNTFPKLKGLAAGIIRLIEAIGGTYYPRASGGILGRKIAGQNIFFSLAELRLHVTQMITALEEDPTSMRLLKRGGYSSLFERALGGLGGQVSIRKSINALTQIIFHETYGQPCPRYIPGKENTVSGIVRARIVDGASTKYIAAEVERFIEGLENTKGTIDTIIDDPVAALVAKPTLKILAQNLSRIGGRIGQLIVKVRKTLRGKPGANRVIGNLTSSRSAVGQARAGVSSAAFRGVAKRKSFIFKKIDSAVERLSKIPSLVVTFTRSADIEPARLQQHILRPDIWFGAPPRCNVLFPDEYTQLSYQRRFLQEPTRFLLKTSDEFGAHELFDKFYFAPQAGSVKKDKTRLRDIRRGAILDHELFTGILPVFEKMPEFNIFASRSGTQSGNVTKIGFAQRTANFIYFKHRFNSRQMRISGKFNPYVAAGFPGLVLDKYVDVATIALFNELKKSAINNDRSNPQKNKYNEGDLPPQEISGILGTNYLGNFTMISHSVSQDPLMSRTEIVCSYPRQPEESVEFLGTVEKVQTIRKRFEKDASRSMDVAALFPPKILSLGPNGGRISQVVEVTSQYAGTGRSALLFTGVRSTKTARRRPVNVPIGEKVTGAQLGFDDVTAAAGDDPNRIVVFKAFNITEDVPRYRREVVDLPAEEFIRPGWYGDVWTSSKIGRAYETFFGTGAITDQQTITDPGGAVVGIPSQAAEDAAIEQDQANIFNDPRKESPAVTALDEKASIQDAVEFLLLTYSYIRQNDLDVEQFIRSYTWRPIATMVDLFGTADLELSQSGDVAVSGVEGFHSRAFGPHDDLFGLVGPEIEDILKIKRGEPSAQRGDTRKRKLEAVQRFVAALRFSRAVLA